MRKETSASIAMAVGDDVFAAAVNFVIPTYLAGHCVLAVTWVEKAWLGRDLPYEVNPDVITPLVVRILREVPGPRVTRGVIESLALDMKRASHGQDAAARVAADENVHRVWRAFEDLGVGRLAHDQDGAL